MGTELQKAVSSYISANPDGEKDLARHFEVHPSTVKTWANGVANPHPHVAKLVINYIKDKSRAG